ncbi:hypothetical protein [Sorangium sp. So ce693]|uniref:hypothetical protein n=1 Tax=Sorangium sp. So ce693 TaxID=3133318 RepID=UPI003F60DAB4
MVSTKRDREQANEQAIFLAGAQGLFYVIAGIWPLVNLRTFEAVTGPKSDRWLAKTTGLLIAVIGTTLVISARRSRIPLENERLCRSAGGAPAR